jgi:uncharacterized damage-inducible protein DinB
MDLAWAIAQLTNNGAAIAALVEGIDAEQARWKPAPDAWSVREVINHLYDEEREDFRRRFDLTLHQPEADWPPNDPEGWVVQRSYNSRDLAESVANFRRERAESLTWLRGLRSPDLSREKQLPQFGITLHAGDLLASWVAHDLLHLRQLVELNYGDVRRQAEPYDIGYAGDW